MTLLESSVERVVDDDHLLVGPVDGQRTFDRRANEVAVVIVRDDYRESHRPTYWFRTTFSSCTARRQLALCLRRQAVFTKVGQPIRLVDNAGEVLRQLGRRDFRRNQVPRTELDDVGSSADIRVR